MSVVTRCQKCNNNYVRCHNYCPAPKGIKLKSTKNKELEILQDKLENYFDALSDEYPSLRLSTTGSVALNSFEIKNGLLYSKSVREKRNE